MTDTSLKGQVYYCLLRSKPISGPQFLEECTVRKLTLRKPAFGQQKISKDFFFK